MKIRSRFVVPVKAIDQLLERALYGPDHGSGRAASCHRGSTLDIVVDGAELS